MIRRMMSLSKSLVVHVSLRQYDFCRCDWLSQCGSRTHFHYFSINGIALAVASACARVVQDNEDEEPWVRLRCAMFAGSSSTDNRY